LLALIETPELDQQLAQAKADLATAQSNAGFAKTTASRYQDLIGSNAVSQQDTDNATTQLEARNTQVTSAQANVRRLEELQSFERIEAPFDGVITARNIDIGQLITAAGSTTTAELELFRAAKRSSIFRRTIHFASSSMYRRSTLRMRRMVSSPR